MIKWNKKNSSKAALDGSKDNTEVHDFGTESV